MVFAFGPTHPPPVAQAQVQAIAQARALQQQIQQIQTQQQQILRRAGCSTTDLFTMPTGSDTMATQDSGPKPFTLSTHGRAEIPRPAERAVLNVAVASQGTNKAAVSDDVVTTAQHIERLLRELAPTDTTAEAKEASPLAHWSKTGLSATSFLPYHAPNSKAPQKPREYNARITFDIRFKKFKEMGPFGTKLSALPHVELSHIAWILTPATHKSYESELRRTATRDALEKARDYCDVLGCQNLRPVELVEGNVATGMSGGGSSSLFGSRNAGGGLFGNSQAQAVYAQQPGGPGGAHEERDESPLEFTPKEVKMSMDVTIKFHADPVGVEERSGGSPPSAKRARTDEGTEMEE